MRLPGTQRLGKWAERTFAVTDADKAGIRRMFGDTKNVVSIAALDPVVTGGQMWQAVVTYPKSAITAYVLPTVTRAAAKARREYRRRDPADPYGNEPPAPNGEENP